MKHRSGLVYERCKGPCPGPKRNAIVDLKAFTGRRVSEPAFIDYLQTKFKDYYNSIQRVRFYDFYHRSRGTEEDFSGKLTIALLNTAPDPRAREALFHRRSEITQATGWYPLIMGARASFKATTTPDFTLEAIGPLKGFNPIANSPEKGVAFQLIGKTGKYLFDFGFHGAKKDDYKAYFISHSHSDHAQGFQNTLLNNVSPNPIFTFGSKHSYSFLTNRMKNSPPVKRYEFFADIKFKNELRLKEGFCVRLFPVFHAPGSIGFQVIDETQLSFFYLGDMCLRNGYTNFSKRLAKTLHEGKTEKNILVLDACMLGHAQYIEETDTPETILREFSKNVTRRNVLFFSNQPENSIYSFLKIFRMTQQDPNLRSIKLIVSTSLFRAMSFLIEPAIFQIDEYKDPVYKSLFGSSGSNPVESQRLYPLTSDVLGTMERTERCIIFAGIKDLDYCPELCARLEKADVILSGSFAVREELPLQLKIAKPRLMIRVASADWSFHSNEQDLFDFITQFAAPDFRIFLFHNFKSRISKALAKARIDTTYVKVLGENEFVAFDDVFC